MTLNSKTLKKLESYFPFTLTPEQKSIMLHWFGADSKFGWSKIDFMVGIHRVRRLYPDHRVNLYKGIDGFPSEPTVDFIFDHDGYGNPTIRFYEDDDDVPF